MKLGINIELHDMAADQRALLINQIILELKKSLGINNKTPRCSATNFSSFFKPQVTPEQISEHAKDVATSVRTALFSGTANTAINLPRGAESWSFAGNPKTSEYTRLLP